MDLIAINKILEYISARPESQTAFLTFLKEYEHEFRKRFEQANGFSGAGVGAGSFSLGTGEYIIEYEWRAQLNAICITWLGSREEHQAYINDKRRIMQPTGRKFVVEHVVITISGGRTSTKRTVVPNNDAIEPTTPQPLMVAEFEADSYKNRRSFKHAFRVRTGLEKNYVYF
ncbi:hypothetical protein ABDD95_21085 [Mucilaginibacter sp. PAMB04274]|uniref:hypothetical protein n=1 Tax=Mucilaginibacter sp. PAMB04274 TaxID=3138568 RepID=UPI0031F68E87